MTLIVTVPYDSGVIIVCDKKLTSEDGERDGAVSKKYYLDENRAFVIVEWGRVYHNERLINILKNTSNINENNIIDEVIKIIDDFITAYNNPLNQYGSSSALPQIKIAVIMSNSRAVKIETTIGLTIETTELDILNIINGFPRLSAHITSMHINKKYFRKENALYLGCSVLDLASTFADNIGSSTEYGFDVFVMDSQHGIFQDNIKTNQMYNMFKCFRKFSKNIMVK